MDAKYYTLAGQAMRLTYLQTLGPNAYPYQQEWEEIIERSIQNVKPLGFKKSKQQSTTGSGADAAEEESNDGPEPEDVMIEITWMQPYLAYMINKQLPKDVVIARRIIRRCSDFVDDKGELYENSI
jgi:hypothetical protein